MSSNKKVSAMNSKNVVDFNLEFGINKNENIKRSFPFLQYFGAITASMMYLLLGVHGGWSGPILQKINESTTLNITQQEDSWIASSFTFGSIPAPILGAIGGMVLGRKRTLVLATIPILIGTLLFVTTTSVWSLIVGRILCGIGIAGATPIVPMYISEISSPTRRGRLGSIIMAEYNIGVLIIYAMGPYVSITVNSIILIFIILLFILSFSFMPESPYYSVISNQPKLAYDALEKFQVSNDNQEKLIEIQEYIKELKDKNVSYLDLFRIDSNRKALFYTLLLTTTNALTGINVILAYAQTIFDEIGSDISSNYASIAFATVGVFTVVLASFFVDTWGRRPLLIVSTSSTAICLFLIGLYFFLKYIDFEYITEITLLPVIFLILSKITMSIGITPLPQVCVGEMFPSNLIAIASCFIEFYGNILRFIVIQSYRIISINFGIYSVFWLFCLCCTINTVIIIMVFPETKNKSLEE
ncbi:facilitated trehalose transporter Tret1-like, partial [Chrysoperla carnea]|uniref:facilitated trehalose transporter Tret1-like n=1 Tax=Chrysoperla carnea TaxID=189513 RepID=UPI001D0841EB